MAYKHAPITEAVIELRFASSFEKKTVERAAKRLSRHYEHFEEENSVRFRIEPSTQKSSFDSKWHGIKLSSSDRTDIVIFRRTSFVCSRLAPYPGWEVFVSSAMRGWDAWKKAAGQTALSRIGVRYVNRIDIPLEKNSVLKVEDYVRFTPISPHELAEPMVSYAMQVVRPLGVDDCSLSIISGTVTSPLIGHVSLAVDIDVFRDSDLPVKDDELWELLDKIRAHKNRVFESCITDRSRAIFDQ